MKEGVKNVDGFIGVYALNYLPIFLSKPSIPTRFIVNTQTYNLPGEHWLAVSFEENGIILAFDPMGFYYPLYLVTYLQKHSQRIYYNRKQYQLPGTIVCGEICLRFLKSLKNKTLTEKVSMLE